MTADLSDVYAALHASLAEELPRAVRLRHELHARPELSGREEETAARVAAALDASETPVVAGTGRLVRIGPARGPCVAVRGELDALPLVERTGTAFASRGGTMHACGHDVHLAGLVALGRAARRLELPRALLMVLQPREESPPSGAYDVARSAGLAEHDVRAFVGVHLQPRLPEGLVAATPGAVNAASDQFEIVVRGRGGHAGYPHVSRDPVLALCQVVVSLQQLVSRRTDPVHAGAVSVGTLEAGSAANVLPEAARARGVLRTLEPHDRAPLLDALREAVEYTARAHGCTASVVVTPEEPALVNDPALTAATEPWLSKVGFDLAPPFRSCGADDFSHYAEVAPSLMMFLGVGTGAPEEPGLHHPEFLPPDASVAGVAAVMLAGYLGALDLIG